MGGYSCGAGAWPNFNAMLENIWGSGQEYSTSWPGNLFGSAANQVFGQNPPYYLDDFKAVYPNFFGLPTALSGCTTVVGSPIVTVPTTNGLDYGQFLQAWGVLPKGAVICDIGDGTITLNVNATVASSNATLRIYEASPIPTGVIQLYLNLAWASLVQARWCDQWVIGMSLYIAHYLTLYARSSSSEVMTLLQTAIHGEQPVSQGTEPWSVFALSAAPPGGALQALTNNGLFQVPGVAYTLAGSTITLASAITVNNLYATWPVQTEVFTSVPPTGASIAAAGLAGGLQVSKSVGDVSVSYSALTSLEQFGAWNLTQFGQQLATMAKVIGMGPSVIY
jgi:hypothetical protein